MKLTIIIVTLFTTSLSLVSQEQEFTPQREIKLSFGASFLNVMDKRLSAVTYRKIAPALQFQFNKIKEESKESFTLSYIHLSNYDSGRLLDLTMFRPVVDYSYERKMGDIWIGGNFNSTTQLIFPRSQSGIFNNNPVSYTMLNSIGPKVSYQTDFGNGENNRGGVVSSLSVPLLNYNIRPGYGHPYPDKYLESGTFSPTRQGMAGPLLRSGKIQTLNKHQAFVVTFGLLYQVSDNIRISLDAKYDYVHNHSHDDVSFQSTDVLLGVSYTY